MPEHTWPTCRYQHLLGTCKPKARRAERLKGSAIVVPIQECMYLGLLNGSWKINGRKESEFVFFLKLIDIDPSMVVTRGKGHGRVVKGKEGL